MGPLPQPHSSAFPFLVMWHGESFSLCQAWRVRAGKSSVHALFPRSETSLTGLLSLSLVPPHLPMVMLDTQKKTPMTVLGSPRTLKSLNPPCPATQGRNWRKRRKVRCPCPDGLRGPGVGAEGGDGEGEAFTETASQKSRSSLQKWGVVGRPWGYSHSGGTTY